MLTFQAAPWIVRHYFPHACEQSQLMANTQVNHPMGPSLFVFFHRCSVKCLALLGCSAALQLGTETTCLTVKSEISQMPLHYIILSTLIIPALGWSGKIEASTSTDLKVKRHSKLCPSKIRTLQSWHHLEMKKLTSWQFTKYAETYQLQNRLTASCSGWEVCLASARRSGLLAHGRPVNRNKTAVGLFFSR